MMVCHDTYTRNGLIYAVEEGTATEVKEAAFVIEELGEKQFTTNFYYWKGILYSVRYNHRSTEWVVTMITGSDLEEFQIHYPVK